MFYLVGAGLSASSGLPTFRGSGGLWRNYDAMDLATPDAFQNDPSLVWQFYSYRRHAALRAKPNKGHYALAELARRRPGQFLTLTQNVDGLSARAQHPQEDLLCLHGDLFTVKCTSFMCSYKQEGVLDDPLTPALKVDDEEYAADPNYKKLNGGVATEDSDALKKSIFGKGPLMEQRDAGYSSGGLTTTDGLTTDGTDGYSSSSSFFFPNGYNAPPTGRKKKTEEVEPSVIEKEKEEEQEQEEQEEQEESKDNNDSHAHAKKKSRKKKFITKDIPIDLLPRCPSCKVGLLRPGVVWFGEALPFNVLQRADDFITADPPVDLILVIGTSGSVWPAAGYVEQVAMRGGKVAVFNIDVDEESSIATDLIKNGGGWAFQGDAAEILPKALEPIIGTLRPHRKY